MDKVDRNILRLAAYELTACPDIPRAASINEAVELAKLFSSPESAAFINGVLDQLARNKPEPKAEQLHA
jgi:N utilization substance protein B